MVRIWDAQMGACNQQPPGISSRYMIYIVETRYMIYMIYWQFWQQRRTAPGFPVRILSIVVSVVPIESILDLEFCAEITSDILDSEIWQASAIIRMDTKDQPAEIVEISNIPEHASSTHEHVHHVQCNIKMGNVCL